jgi:hypothetical protein
VYDKIFTLLAFWLGVLLVSVEFNRKGERKIFLRNFNNIVEKQRTETKLMSQKCPERSD